VCYDSDINGTYIDATEVGEDLLKILRRLVWYVDAPASLTSALNRLLETFEWPPDNTRNVTKLRMYMLI
jgi:hypothetical protein